ncbi:MAG: hypothetical protein QM778_16355 [Myxococcales bacterium]
MDDDQLWAAFNDGSLRAAAWNHEAHLRMAYLFLKRFEFDEAHLRLRAGIIRLNERHGVVESAARGYFETMTRAWLYLVAEATRRTQGAGSLELLSQAPELRDRTSIQRHYSPELLATSRARAIFLEPDREPLP